MEKFLNKAEKKFGKYAINNLTFYIIMLYVIGYLILQLAVTIPNSFIRSIPGYLTLDIYRVGHGEVWRLITWIIIPPSSSSLLWFIISLFCTYSFGKSLEATWGAFRYNIFIFSGVILTAIGAALSGALLSLIYNYSYAVSSTLVSMMISTEYIVMSIFLMVTAMYPHMTVLLFFIIPLKSLYVAIFFVAMQAYSIISIAWMAPNTAELYMIPLGVSFFMALINFLIYFLGGKNLSYYSKAERKRREDFRRAVNSARNAGQAGGFGTYSGRFSRTGEGSAEASTGTRISKHKCAICGRTEQDDPDLEFRFCSKCNGNYEYCNDHLFTHTHK